ncbi:MAG: hypothetical protein GY937_26425 [bacterium]|nr:hypothetical protein [bacterium]
MTVLDKQISDWRHSYSEPQAEESQASGDSGSDSSESEVQSTGSGPEVKNLKHKKPSSYDLAALTRENRLAMLEAQMQSPQQASRSKGYKTPEPRKFSGKENGWVDWAEDFERWAHFQGLPEQDKVSQVGAWFVDEAKTAYKQFLDRISLHKTPNFQELYDEFTRLFEEYLSPEAARIELETLRWDMQKKSPGQFIARIRHLCRITYPSFSGLQQDQEAGARLMARIPIDIKSQVRLRVGPTLDIVTLR